MSLERKKVKKIMKQTLKTPQKKYTQMANSTRKRERQRNNQDMVKKNDYKKPRKEKREKE